ncbi:zinc finger protein ZAT1-like [Momordica charantia]|uniref:Zinc finger protein ZAT1-like n=1 Tax=Momordica charantia TaxID=3673 RepID=A0A6J1DXK2_MOMCH|nr:zinc finger protein ZAT1-like [Momordica charantia]
MDKQRVCKICSKSFSNGKAMGGHMRSHLIKLPLHPNPKRIPIPMPMSMPIPTSIHSHYSDRESETDDLPPKQRRRRSLKRKRHDPTIECAAALSLVMMSRDQTTEKSQKLSDKESNYTCKDEDGEDVDSFIWKFKCKTCDKSFRSYQALGGHKASHSKIRTEDCVHQKVFQCLFCPKVFESGQALGGHKKVHFFKKISPKKFGKNSIDLNRPPPAYDYDEDDEDEVSEIEFSAISNPC